MSQVVGWRVMLGVIVCHVGCAFVPVESELSLGGTAAQPVEAHPNHFDSSLDDRVLDESGGG